MPVNEGAVLLAERIGDATGARDRPTAKKKRETEPMVLGTVTLDQIDAIAAAEKPDAKGNKGIDPMFERHRNYRSAQLARFDHHLAGRVANEPGAMTICIQPIDLETGAILLSAPTATALKMK